MQLHLRGRKRGLVRQLRVTAESEFAAAVENAEALSENHRYREAGRLYAKACAFALKHGVLDAARQTSAAAGENFRRDDAMEEAADALRLALSLPGGSPSEVALQRVQLAHVLSERGNGDAAVEQCHMALEGGPSVRPLVVDALVGTLLGYGSRDELIPWIEQLDGVGQSRWAFLLRRAQWLRLTGELSEALALLDELEASLEGPNLEAGIGGVRAEKAEIAALLGETSGAADAWEAAKRDQEKAGRKALALRCEAGRVRALVDAGVSPVTRELEEGVSWATDRGMVLLGLDLELAWAAATGDRIRLASVRDRCLGLGLDRRAGRAEYRRGLELSGPARLSALQDAARLLGEDEPRRLRVEVARAEALHSVSSGASQALARQLEPMVAKTGMAPELARLHALLEE